jgi:ADP-ribosylglycohydrolase
MPLTIQALDLASPAPLSPGGYAPEVLQAAVQFVAVYDSFADALGASLAFAGSANYCPVLVGVVAGARWGATAIPPTMLPEWGLMDRVRNAAEILAHEWEETG